MASIVLAVATSHGPMLSTPPEHWNLRADADRSNKIHRYRGGVYDYNELLARRGPFAAANITAEQQRQHFHECQAHLDGLAQAVAAAHADLAIIVGNDQRELLLDDLRPAITVIGADPIENVPLRPDQVAQLPAGIAIAEEGHVPPGGARYRGAAAAASQMAAALNDLSFDVGYSATLPTGNDRQEGIPHAFGFVYRRLFQDVPPPSIPIVLNVGVPPNRPRAERCLELGHALAKATGELPFDMRVVLVASGGLTHFVIDDQLDDLVLTAIRTQDEAALAAIPEELFAGNTAEIKNWLPVVAAAWNAGLPLTSLDYVPCYRTEAGTGNAMGFASWGAADVSP
jgi:Catalytic LigB subunit of aromatic ring-opening dioxygenase